MDNLDTSKTTEYSCEGVFRQMEPIKSEIRLFIQIEQIDAQEYTQHAPVIFNDDEMKRKNEIKQIMPMIHQ